MLDETIDILGTLIGFPTVSSDSNLGMIAWLAERLSDAGARIELSHDESASKANLFATLGPEGDGGVVLSGHTDVVPAGGQPWNSDPFVMEARHGRLYGRGSCDMKGFIAASIALLPYVQPDRLRRPLHFAFTYDEEVGCLGGQQLVAHLADRSLRPAVAIIGEPTGMRVVEGHKGCHEYTTRFTGREGHGSAPDAGVNAVEMAVRYAGRLLELRETLKGRAPSGSRFAPPWTTVNLGRLTGGTAHNVIAGEATLDWEMRPVHAADADFVRDALVRYCEEELLPAMRRVAPEARIETQVIGEVVGLEPLEENLARRLVAQLTGRDAAELVPFSTEAGLFQSLGTHCVVCGPGEIAQAHKPDEFVEAEQLAQCCTMLKGLASHLT
ncbi:acetylornithine deacetylase [Halovulum sp. GXIMD14794]